MEKSLAIIGVGNLGGALARGLCKSLYQDPKKVFVYDADTSKVKTLEKDLGLSGSNDLEKAVKTAETIILALKPEKTLSVSRELLPFISQHLKPPTIISVAAGISHESLQQCYGSAAVVVRVMPNTPSLVACGMSAIYSPTQEGAIIAEQIFASVGQTVILNKESELDAATGLSASGPAFIFVAIEALADAGVKMGLPRAEALKMASQTVYGAAALVIKTGEHPAKLKDQVASPGGTTIAGLHVLEKAGFRGTIIAAVEAAVKRAKELKG